MIVIGRNDDVQLELADFGRAATFGSLVDLHLQLKPRVLEVMKENAIGAGNCPALDGCRA